jgi:hypothetical protein
MTQAISTAPTRRRFLSTRVVQSLARTRSLEDWRDWVLHVSDDLGDELLVVSFALVLSNPH